MSDKQERGGFRGGFGGRGRGTRGESRGGFGGESRGGRGGQRGGQRGGAPSQFKKVDDWTPVTKLGRLVKEGKINSLEEIQKHSLPIKEPEIFENLLKDKMKEEVMKIKPVQKQTRAGQRTRFSAAVAIGDLDGHIGLGQKVAKEVQTAIKGAIRVAKLNIVPVRRGYWGNNIGLPHTVPFKVTGKSGSVRVRLVPAPRGTGIVAAPACKKILQFAGIYDCYTSTKGCTKTKLNFIKATQQALTKTQSFLTPDLWKQDKLEKTPYQEYSDYLAEMGNDQ